MTYLVVAAVLLTLLCVVKGHFKIEFLPRVG